MKRRTAKSKPESPKPAQPLSAVSPTTPAIRPKVAPVVLPKGTVTLWGEILKEADGHIQMAVRNHGAALDLGLCGTHWIAKRQIFGDVRRQDGFDYIRIGYVYASMLAQSSQQCE